MAEPEEEKPVVVETRKLIVSYPGFPKYQNCEYTAVKYSNGTTDLLAPEGHGVKWFMMQTGKACLDAWMNSIPKDSGFTIEHSQGGSMGAKLSVKLNGRWVGHFYPDGNEEDVETFCALMGGIKE